MDLTNKVIIVSGGSGGLGKTLSIDLARAGAAVAILYHRNREAAETVRQEITSTGGTAAAIQTDLACPDMVDQSVQQVVKTFGTIDGLVNCAGISRNSVSWKIKNEDWKDTIDVNLSGVFFCCRSVIPVMREKMWGRIINISSIVGQIGVAGTCAYAASKAGLVGMTKSMALEVANKSITVNCIALGYFDAGLTDSLPADKLPLIIENIPVNRLGLVSEFSGLVRYLCGPDSGYLTGQVINLNGGMYLG